MKPLVTCWMVTLAVALAVTPLLAQTSSVSVAPANKGDFPNGDVLARLVASKEIPIPNVQSRWIVPPVPIPFDWAAERDDQQLPQWEHSWEVTHIKFDHSPGHGNDGMDIRWSYKEDLDHKGNGVGSGEYDVAAERNEPALYMVQTAAVVKVRIQCKGPGTVRLATIRAEANTSDTFMNLNERDVAFGANGISIGDDGTEYVEFLINGVVPIQVGEYITRYKFYLKNPVDAAGVPADPPREVLFDELARIDLYSVYRFPRQPWNHATSGEPKTLEWTQPWVTALGFTCYACGCADQSSLNTLVGNTVKHLHWGHTGTAGHGMKYNHNNGAPGFTGGRGGSYSHRLTQYMTKKQGSTNFNTVNCADQACSVHALMQLAYTAKTTGLYLRGDGTNRDWFGYMSSSLFVGGVQSNHPFYENPEYVNSATVGNDDLMTQVDANNKKKRSAFDFHAAVRVDGGSMADACFGPVDPASGLAMAAYLTQYRDTSVQGEQTINGKGVFASGDEQTIDLTIR